MRSNRAGLGNLVMWLASADRKRAAWSQSLFEFTAGTKRSGKKARNAGLAAQVGKAFALTKGDEWGGLDAVASDAIVAEEHVRDREFAVKDDADTETPGLELWRETGQDKNIRTAKPLEALVARAAKVGPGFENEHVAFPARARLIAHHRPDDPPINSTWVYDPGDGSRDDWRAGLHGPLRVRPWLEKFCAAAPNPKDTASSFEEEAPTLALLLNATKSAGDNSGWLGAHFAQAEATLSAEAFGFAHPADDGFHRLGIGFDGTEILEGGLEAFRTKFGSRGSLLYSPLAMSPDQWPFPGRSIFPVLTEIREDYTDRHATQCGTAPGYKKLVTWIPLLDPGPPTLIKPPWKPVTEPKYPGIIKVPFEGEDTGDPDLFGGGGGGGGGAGANGLPGSLSGDGFWEGGRSIEDLQRDYPAAGMVPPANFGERSAAAMSQLEATSMQYRARPALPDGQLTLFSGGETEADVLANLMYGYTVRQALQAPVVADDVASPNYLFNSPRDHDDPNQRWPMQLSNAAELSENGVGGISGRIPARGPGSVFIMPSNVHVDWQYVENKDRWRGTPNATLRAILAGKNAAGVVIPGRGGIGLRNLAGDLVSGWQYELEYTDSSTEPNINWIKKDASGANAGVGKFKVNGVEVGGFPNLIQVTPENLLLPGDVDDHPVASSLLLCDPSTATRRLTGMVAAIGALVKIENVSGDGTDLVLAHLSDSSAGNQFFCPAAADVTLEPGHGCWAAYDDVNDHWVLNGVPGSGSGDVTAPDGNFATADALVKVHTGGTKGVKDSVELYLENAGIGAAHTLRGGNVGDGTSSKGLLIRTGNAGNDLGDVSGDVDLDTGTGAARGTVGLGRTNAEGVSIGRAGKATTVIGRLAVTQGFSPIVSRLTDDATLDAAYCVVLVNKGTAVTVTLPASPSAANGNFYIIKNVGAGTLTIARNGNDINGAAADLTLVTGEATTLVWNSTQKWHEV